MGHRMNLMAESRDQELRGTGSKISCVIPEIQNFNRFLVHYSGFVAISISFNSRICIRHAVNYRKWRCHGLQKEKTFLFLCFSLYLTPDVFKLRRILKQGFAKCKITKFLTKPHSAKEGFLQKNCIFGMKSSFSWAHSHIKTSPELSRDGTLQSDEIRGFLSNLRVIFIFKLISLQK